MLRNFCFDYWIILYSIPIFFCSKYYLVYKPFHLRCDSQVNFFINDSLSQPSNSPSNEKIARKLENLEKYQPSLASIWHAIPLDSCEIDKQIGTLYWHAWCHTRAHRTTKNRISTNSEAYSDDGDNSRWNSLHHFTFFINWLIRGNFI